MASRSFVAGLASGLAGGFQIGQGMDLREKAEKRAKESHDLSIQLGNLQKSELERTAQMRDRQEAAWKGLAQLVDEYTGLPQPKLPIAAQGVNADPVAASSGVGDAADAGNASAAAGPGNRSAALRFGANPASEPNKGPSPDDYQNRVGFGLYRNPSLFQDPAFLNSASKIFLNSGMPEGVKWLQRSAVAQKENAIEATKRLLAGDPQGAEAAFNASGGMKLQPGSLREIGNGKWQATTVDGTITTFDPKESLRSFLSPHDFFTTAAKEAELASQVAKRREAAAHQARQDTATAEWRDRTATETERHNRESEAILARRSEHGLTAEQERQNAEIDAAREAVSGLSAQEIMRRTAKATNTGRENPDYDPGLARQVALANRRKIGPDEAFDARAGQRAPASSPDRADVMKRFQSDKAMAGRTLGKDTPNGTEVLQDGKLIGYYR